MSKLTEVAQYRIPDSNWEKLNTKLEALNKRAAKLGASPIILKSEGRRVT